MTHIFWIAGNPVRFEAATFLLAVLVFVLESGVGVSCVVLVLSLEGALVPGVVVAVGGLLDEPVLLLFLLLGFDELLPEDVGGGVLVLPPPLLPPLLPLPPPLDPPEVVKVKVPPVVTPFHMSVWLPA